MICSEPWATAAIPPMTTKSTPPSVSARRSAPRRKSGHSGNRCLRLVGPLAQIGVHAVVALDALARREPQRVAEHGSRPRSTAARCACSTSARPITLSARCSVATVTSSPAASSRATDGWVIPSRRASCACVSPSASRAARINEPVRHRAQTISTKVDHVTSRTRAYPQRSPMSDLENRTRYEPAEAEPRVFERWEASGRFHPEPTGSPEENYSIAIPPPNVTGALHMGHALNGSIQDTLIRYARMQGTRHEVDPRHRPRRHRDPDAGRAALKAEGTSQRGARPRGVPRAHVAAGASSTAARSSTSTSGSAPPCDYEDERFTLDERYVRAVLKVFVDALRQGPDLPRQLHGQLGPGLAARRSRTSRSRTARSPTRSTTSTTRSRPATARSRSPPCARRRCWATPRSPSTPTTTATRGWWGRPRSCRSSAAGCGSSPTSTSSPSSAPAR